MKEHLLKRFFSAQKKLKIFLILLCFSSISESIFAHGTVVWPASRIYKCYKNPSSGNCGPCGGNIYNWNSVLQPNTENGNHRKFVPDGKIASGGNGQFNFSCLDALSSRWATTKVNHGYINVKWLNSAPHKTQYYKVYITPLNWDPTKPLVWSELIEIGSIGKRPAEKYSTIKSRIPDSYAGKRAALVSVWQRDYTQSHEAFYAVSDIMVSHKKSPSSNPDGDTNGSTVDDNGDDDHGDHGDHGNKEYDCSKYSTWSNSKYYWTNSFVKLSGVLYQAKRGTRGNNPARSPQMWKKLGTCKGGDQTDNGDTDNGNNNKQYNCSRVSTWSSTKGYGAKSYVKLSGVLYQAIRWTRGQNPSRSSQFWKKLGTCTGDQTDNGDTDNDNNNKQYNCSRVSTWSSSKGYGAKSYVKLSGVLYQAIRWTRGQNPSRSSQFWKKLGTCTGDQTDNGNTDNDNNKEYNCSRVLTWSSTKYYRANNYVKLSGKLYQAQRATRGNSPANSPQIWKKLGTCTGDQTDNGNTDNDNNDKKYNCSRISVWSSTKDYGTNNYTKYLGVLYQAKTWTRGHNPSKSPQKWKKLGTCTGGQTDTGNNNNNNNNNKVYDCSRVPSWSSNSSYREKAYVKHSGVLYQAQYWNRSKNPVNYSGVNHRVWKKLGVCSSNSRKRSSTYEDFSILNNVPNPFVDNTELRYKVDTTKKLTLTIRTISNQIIQTVFSNRTKLPGVHKQLLDLKTIKTGVYLCVLEDENGVVKMIKISKK